MSCFETIPHLDLGTLEIGRTWGGFAWAMVDPVTSLPVDLSSASALCHWRRDPGAHIPSSPDTPDLTITSSDDGIVFEDGVESLDDLTFAEYMDAREPGDPLPAVGYPWIVSIEPMLITTDPQFAPATYEGDVKIDVLDDETDVRTIRRFYATLINPVTRG